MTRTVLPNFGAAALRPVNGISNHAWLQVGADSGPANPGTCCGDANRRRVRAMPVRPGCGPSSRQCSDPGPQCTLLVEAIFCGGSVVVNAAVVGRLQRGRTLHLHPVALHTTGFQPDVGAYRVSRPVFKVQPSPLIKAFLLALAYHFASLNDDPLAHQGRGRL